MEYKVLKSFDDKDGKKQVQALSQILERTTHDGEPRLKIYPAKSERVLRVIRKIVRGLSSFHGVEAAVNEERIWADVLRFEVPDYLLQKMNYEHREREIVDYWYETPTQDDPHSYWVLRFFQRTRFVAAVHSDKCTAHSNSQCQLLDL